MTAFYDDKVLDDELGQGDLDFADLFEYEALGSDTAAGGQGLSQVMLFVGFCVFTGLKSALEACWGN